MAKGIRNEQVFLEDILECIEKIGMYLQNMTEQQFEQNSEKQDAVIRRIEIIGEAVKNISVQTRDKYPDIPWRQMAGMRDVVIHEYFGVSIGMVWQVAVFDLQEIKEKLVRVLKDLDT